MLSSGGERVYAPGEVIVKAGEEPESVYVLMEGSARIVYHVGSENLPRWAVVDIVGAGRLFGLVPALDGNPYMAQLEALTEVKVVTVPRQAFLDELRSHPEVASNLLLQLAAYVRNSERWLVSTI